MVIQWKKYMFKVNEFRNGENENMEMEKADLHIYLQQEQLIQYHPVLAIFKRSLTLLINLHKTEEEMRKEMNRTTRYQINKGARERFNLTYVHNASNREIEEFAAFFNPFAIEKGIDKCRVDKLKAMRDKRMLLFTYVFDEEGRRLAAHAYIINEKRTTMFYSCSNRFSDASVPGSFISCANRYMHWRNILYFKEQGFSIYDFMGYH